MDNDVFEFKGKMYKRHPNWMYRGTVSITLVGETPNYKPYRAPKEKIPDHLRNLNKQQLRARITHLEELLYND